MPFPPKKVLFDDNVLVVPIPSRHEYSDRIKKAFWRDGQEIKNIADRNRYEYISEGWDWKLVLEDEDMYVDINTGDKVHPCWVERENNDEEHDDDSEGSLDSLEFNAAATTTRNAADGIEPNDQYNDNISKEEFMSFASDDDFPMLTRRGSISLS